LTSQNQNNFSVCWDSVYNRLNRDYLASENLQQLSTVDFQCVGDIWHYVFGITFLCRFGVGLGSDNLTLL